MPSPTPPQDEGGMGWSLRRGDPLCPHAFSGQLSLQREYKIPKYNKPSKRDGKDKKSGGGREALQYHSRHLALKATRQTVGMHAANCAPVQAPTATSCINLV